MFYFMTFIKEIMQNIVAAHFEIVLTFKNVCVHFYVFLCVVCVHSCMYVYANTCIHVYVHSCVFVCVVCLHSCACVCVCV